MTMRKFVRRPGGKFLCAILAMALATSPAARAQAQQPTTSPSEEIKLELPENIVVEAQEPRQVVPGASGKTLLAAPSAGKIDLTYVTPQAVALVSLRPHQLLTSPNTSMFPVEVASALGLQQLNMDPVDVNEIVVFLEPPTVMGLNYGAVIKFAKPFDLAQLPQAMLAHTQVSDFAGKQYLQSANAMQPSFYMPDERTLLVMTDIALRKTLAPIDAAATSPLLDRVRELPGGDDLYAVVDVASLRPLVVPWMNVAVAQQRDQFPAEAKPFLEIPDLVASVDLALNITNSSPTVMVIHANDAASADKLDSLYELGMELQRKQARAEAAQLLASHDPLERAMGKYIERMSNTSVDAYKYERHGDDLILFELSAANSSPQAQLVMVAMSGVLVALLLPAIQAAREAARKNQSLYKLKQLLLAMHTYADSHKVLPPHASYSADGKPLLSWRVHMLPYLEEQALYEQFHLDEPWDSPHNRTLIEKMPAIYQNPNVSATGKTNYLAFVGPACVLDGSPNGISFARISDGSSRTVVIAEADADQAVEWTKPDDIEFEPNRPLAGLGNLRPGGFNVGYCDGRAQFLSKEIDPGVFKALVTRNGRETVQLP